MAEKSSKSEPAAAEPAERYLQRVGERVRAARARRGMTRKILSRASGVSERYLAQLEAGEGNVSILRLRDIAQAMHLPVTGLLQEGPEPPVDLALIIEQLRHLDGRDLSEAKALLSRRFAGGQERARRIALIGLRGAGKSTIGRALAERLGVPFVQLDREVEQAGGMRLEELFDLFGQGLYRRLERRCLEDALARHDSAVIETGGSLVSEAATFQRLLSACFTVWLRARPEQHMQRVVAQGDLRPMAGNREAMNDLKRILAERDALYRKADAVLDTSQRDVEQCVQELEKLWRQANREAAR